MRALSLLALLLLAACGEAIDGAPKSGDVLQLPPIEWRVVDRAELERVYENSGMEIQQVNTGGVKRRDRLSGFVGKNEGRWVIYTLPPKRVDDSATCTLGHEALHVLIGDYHR